MSEKPPAMPEGSREINMPSSKEKPVFKKNPYDKDSSGVISVEELETKVVLGIHSTRQSVFTNMDVMATLHTERIENAFDALDSKMQENLLGLLPYKSNPAAFMEWLKICTAADPLFLQKLGDWINNRLVRVNIPYVNELDEGWRVEDNIAEGLKSDVSIVKMAGDFSQYHYGSRKNVHLCNVIPFNIKIPVPETFY